VMPSRGLDSILAALVAVTSGPLLWICAADAAGKVEAWDGPFYFSRVVPALCLIAAGCGFLAPRHAWRWPALIYASQFIVMLARTKGPIGPLVPLGFIMMASLALVTALPAYLGAFAHRRWQSLGRRDAPRQPR